jgi:CIC family chloride channel protein
MRADPKVVLDTIPLRELRQKFPPGSAKNVFVVSESGAFVGALDMTAVHDEKQDEVLDSRFAREFAAHGDLYLLPYENVRTALSRFEDKETEILPVIDSPADKAIVGYLTEQYALRRYNQELERRRNADLGERDLFSIAEPPS